MATPFKQEVLTLEERLQRLERQISLLASNTETFTTGFDARLRKLEEPVIQKSMDFAVLNRATNDLDVRTESNFNGLLLLIVLCEHIEKRLTDLENIFGPGTEPVQYSPLQNRSGLADTDNLEVSEEVEFLPDFDLTEAKRLEAEATEDWFK